MRLRNLLAAMVTALLGACGNPLAVEVTAAEFGDKWPFKAAKATLRCIDQARMVEVDGVSYALNGAALRGGLPRPAAEILKDPDKPTMPELTERAGSLCAK